MMNIIYVLPTFANTLVNQSLRIGIPYPRPESHHTPRVIKEEAVEKMDDATRIETWPTLKKKQHWMFGKVLGKTIEH